MKILYGTTNNGKLQAMESALKLLNIGKQDFKQGYKKNNKEEMKKWQKN